MHVFKPESTILTYPLEPLDGSGSDLLRILEVNDQQQPQNDAFLVPHRKDYYLLVYVKQGVSRHWVDMKPYTLQPNTFYFTVPQQVHLKEETKPLTGTVLCFTEEFLALDDNRLLKKLPLIQNPQHGHALQLSPTDVLFVEDTLAKITTEYRQTGDWQNELVAAYLRVLLLYLSRLYTEQFGHGGRQTDRHLVNRFQELVEARFRDLHDVAAYADLLHLSAGHLSEMIKKQSGKTAIEHIHERLVLEAKRLLFHADLSVKEITAQLGFEDASYFNRFFKRLSGQTPVEYRTATREMYH
ncbi:helix-turn-helix domain-containing protein [Larkinella ripae]